MKTISKLCLLLLLTGAATFISCSDQKSARIKDVQDYLDAYNIKYREQYSASSEGQWLVNTHIVENDTMNAYQSGLAQLARALAWHARGHRFESGILHLFILFF